MKMKAGMTIGALAIVASMAAADLEMTVDIEYPKRLELKIPVREDSDFEIRTVLTGGEFFMTTGHVGRISGVSTNRTIALEYGYQYNLGKSSGSATGSQTDPLDGSMSVRIVSSIWAANPRFVIREVAPPPSPSVIFTNGATMTNVTWTPMSNETKRAAQQRRP